MEQKFSNFQTVIIIALLILIVVGGVAFYRQPKVVSPMEDSKQEGLTDKFADWKTYETSQGLVFSYPPGHGVTENVDPESSDVMNYFIVSLQQDETLRQNPPVLQINASSSMVSVALWEGIPWTGYPDILETLKWKNAQ